MSYQFQRFQKNSPKIVFSIVLSSLVVSSINAEKKYEEVPRFTESKKALELNLLTNSEGVFAIGGSATATENIKVGAGYFKINDIESNFGIKDEVDGAYLTIELKKDVTKNIELFTDWTYVNGVTDKEKIRISKGIVGVGLKNNKTFGYDLTSFAGINSEKNIYAGIEKELGNNWTFVLGTNYDNNLDETSAFINIAYNFESGFATNLTTGLKGAVDSEFKKGITKKYPGESEENPRGLTKVVDEEPVVVPKNCVGFYQPVTDWSSCTVACGGGVKSRTLEYVISENAQNGGNHCSIEVGHEKVETMPCNTKACPEPEPTPEPIACVGSWSNWSSWSSCSASCGGGTKTRTRTFSIDVPVSNGGASCDNTNGETQTQTSSCNTQSCSSGGSTGGSGGGTGGL